MRRTSRPIPDDAPSVSCQHMVAAFGSDAELSRECDAPFSGAVVAICWCFSALLGRSCKEDLRTWRRLATERASLGAAPNNQRHNKACASHAEAAIMQLYHWRPITPQATTTALLLHCQHRRSEVAIVYHSDVAEPGTTPGIAAHRTYFNPNPKHNLRGGQRLSV